MSYEISAGGRVKAAGLSFAMFTDPAIAYLDHPNASNAVLMTNEYSMLRKSPPEAVRDRFFPRDPATSGIIKNGAGLARTSVTNHQGAGQFLVHTLRDNTNPVGQLRIDITRQTGFVIIEDYLRDQLQKNGSSDELYQHIRAVKRMFAEGNLSGAQCAYEKLIQASEERGIQVRRQADVGREGLFFIHPSIPRFPVEMDLVTHDEMRQKGEQLAEQMKDIAHQKRDEYARSHDLSLSKKRDFPPIYFQIDFLIKNDRTIQISDVGLPDVGFFLAAIDYEGNQVVLDAQNTVTDRLQTTSLSIYKKALNHKSNSICFITRKPVLENREDTLEIKEIEILKKAVEQLGFETKVISDEEALQMTSDELGILMNVDVSTPAFQELLKKRVGDESIPMYPDPFLLLAHDELTEHPQVTLQKDTIDLLKGVFTSTERASNIEKPAIQLAAIDQLIRKSGIPDDCAILHMYIPGQPTPVPFYRNDLRGVQIALNYAADTPVVMLRGISVNPDNAVLFDPNGKPVYTMFRYMFNQSI